MRWRCSRHCVRTGAMRACGCPARAKTDRDALSRRTARAGARSWASPTSSRSPRRPTRIADAYAASDLVLQLSRKPEAFGRTVIEAIVTSGARWWAGRTAASANCCAASAARRRAALRRRRCWNARRTHCWTHRRRVRLRCRTPCVPCRRRRSRSMQNSTRLTNARNAATGWRWAPAWVLAFVALWPAPGYAEGVLVLGALAAIVKLLLARFRGGTRLAERPGVGADQRAVLRLLAARSGFGASMRWIAARALREAAVDLRYLPFLWLVAAAVADARGRRITFGGLAIIVGIVDAGCAAAGGLRHQPAVLRHRRGQAGDQRPRHVLDRSGAGARPPQRHPRAVQPQARAGAGQPVAVRAVLAAASASAWSAGAWRRCGDRHGGAARRRARGVADVSRWCCCGRAGACSGWKRLLGVFAFGAIALVVLGTWSSPQVARTHRAHHAAGLGERSRRRQRVVRPHADLVGGARACIARIRSTAWARAGSARRSPAAIRARAASRRGAKARRCTRTRSCWKWLSETGAIRPAAVAGRRCARLARVALRDRRWRATARGRRCSRWRSPCSRSTRTWRSYSTFWGGLVLLLAALYAGSLLARDAEPEEARA